MKRKIVSLILSLVIIFGVFTSPSSGESTENSKALTKYLGARKLSVELIARYDSKSGEGGAEILYVAPKAKKGFVVNGEEKALDIFDLSKIKSDGKVTEIEQIKRIKVEEITGIDSAKDFTSVAVNSDETVVAVAIPAEESTNPGSVAFLDIDGNVLNAVKVGPLPDMVTFTSDGTKVLVANEGEPNDDFTIDPEGSVSIIDLSKGVEKATVTNAVFDEDVEIEGSVRKANPNHSYAQTLEPEYIVLSSDETLAYVVCQESNAIATLDTKTNKFTKVNSLGFKDYSVKGNEIDASDKDNGINFANYPVLSMYNPDGIDILTVDGKDYIVTPNEGDSQDYDGYSEEERVGKLENIKLNADNYKGYTQGELDALVADGLFEDEKLGRLKITTVEGKNDVGEYEALYGYGGRSFSIFNAEDMSLVFDSGNDFEKITSLALPAYFNTTDDELAMDGRSDDKGPEPEDIEIGRIGDNQYAFIALERIGGIIVYDVSNPKAPVFDQYFTSRIFNDKEATGDLAPEGQYFLSADQSPTGNALLIVGNEVSGTVAVFEIKENTNTDITILHTNDIHGRALEGRYAGMGMAKVATLVSEERAKNENILLLDAGDTFHGTTFATLEQGESMVKLMNAMGYDFMVPGNHDFNYGYERLLELEKMAEFEIICANILDKDGNLIFKEYAIKEIGGIKVAVFGLATPETTYKTHPDNVKGLTFKDPVVAAKEMVRKIGTSADVIIALAHLGIAESSTDTSLEVAKEVDGIDLIVDGHSHTVLTNGIVENNTMIVSVGEYNKNLGIVNVEVKDKVVSNITSRLFSKSQAANINEDTGISGVMKEIQDSQAKVLSQVVGNSLVILDGERGQVRTGETNLGNLITDAMIAESGAEIAFTNGGGIRASIDIGEITKGEVITVLPFGNYIVTKELKGMEIKEVLEHGTSSYPEAKGAFPHVGGLNYSINSSKDVGNRVVDIRVGEKPIDLNKKYVVATNDFLAAGGDGYYMLKDAPLVNEYQGLDEALIDYIGKQQAVSPKIEGRISIVENNLQTYVVKVGDVLWKIAEKFNTTWQEIQEANNIKRPDYIVPGQRLVIPK